jgi:hyperosmotically inducible protein
MQKCQLRLLSVATLMAVGVAALGACSPEQREEQPRASTSAAAPPANTAPVAQGGGNLIDDATLTTKVKTALLADNQVKGLKIDVDSSGGTVTLSGNVDTASEKMRAEQVAQGVDGVKSVRNNLAAP